MLRRVGRPPFVLGGMVLVPHLAFGPAVGMYASISDEMVSMAGQRRQRKGSGVQEEGTVPVSGSEKRSKPTSALHGGRTWEMKKMKIGRVADERCG